MTVDIREREKKHVPTPYNVGKRLDGRLWISSQNTIKFCNLKVTQILMRTVSPSNVSAHLL